MGVPKLFRYAMAGGLGEFVPRFRHPLIWNSPDACMGVDTNCLLHVFAARESSAADVVVAMADWAAAAANAGRVVFVFDSPVPVQAKQDGAGRLRAASASRQSGRVRVDASLVVLVSGALRASGHTVIHAPAQADHQLAAMYRDGRISMVYTVDADLWVLGVRVVRTVRGRNGYEVFEPVGARTSVAALAQSVASPPDLRHACDGVSACSSLCRACASRLAVMAEITVRR